MQQTQIDTEEYIIAEYSAAQKRIEQNAEAEKVN